MGYLQTTLAKNRRSHKLFRGTTALMRVELENTYPTLGRRYAAWIALSGTKPLAAPTQPPAKPPSRSPKSAALRKRPKQRKMMKSPCL